MSTKQMPAVIASARRSHRNALLAATDAVRAFAMKSERQRELSFGMLLLLGEIAGDTDGDDTLDVMEEFEAIYFAQLRKTDEGCVVGAAVNRLEIEAKVLNKLVRG
jgi:hypothetical protein